MHTTVKPAGTPYLFALLLCGCASGPEPRTQPRDPAPRPAGRTPARTARPVSEPPLNCKAIRKRNLKCLEAFVRYAGERVFKLNKGDKLQARLQSLPKKSLERSILQARLERLRKVGEAMGRLMKSLVAGEQMMKECTKNLHTRNHWGERLRRILGECMRESNCRTYAGCYARLLERPKKP